MDICVGDVFLSRTGNRYKVIGLTLGEKDGSGKVRVLRLEPRPKWDDGLYIWHPSSFAEGGDLKLVEVGK